MLRILIVSQYFWPENFRINELASELAKREHEITVLTGWPNYPKGKVFTEFREGSNKFSSYGNVSIIRVPLIPRGRSRIMLALNYASFAVFASTIGLWKLRRKRFDIIFSYLVSPVTAALPAVVIGRLKRTPVAIWILDLWPDSLSAVGAVRSRAILAAVGQIVSHIYRHAAGIFVQSRMFVGNVLRYGGQQNRIHYLPGWAEQVFKELASPASEFEAFAGKFKILFAGNIGDAQDFPSIIDAIEMLRDRRDIHWIIAGDGRAKEQSILRIEKSGLGDRVSFLGQYPIERMPSFFRSADALLVSLKPGSIFELTIPGKVQAYLAAGVPILGMLDGEGARVIKEAGAGVVCRAGDGRELARQVLSLSDMPSEDRMAMGERGKAYAAREFDRDLIVDNLERELVRISSDAGPKKEIAC